MESSTRLFSETHDRVLVSMQRHAPATRPGAINSSRWDRYDNSDSG
jgi:hypothetical protein